MTKQCFCAGSLWKNLPCTTDTENNTGAGFQMKQDSLLLYVHQPSPLCLTSRAIPFLWKFIIPLPGFLPHYPHPMISKQPVCHSHSALIFIKTDSEQDNGHSVTKPVTHYKWDLCESTSKAGIYRSEIKGGPEASDCMRPGPLCNITSPQDTSTEYCSFKWKQQ